MKEQTWWIGAAAPRGDRNLVLGTEHPTRAGAVRLELALEGSTITRAAVGIGHSHRGAEKLFEVRDHRQGLGLADRHDWQAASFGETSLALAVESALGVQVAERARFLRVVALEHARIHALLGMLSWLPDQRCREMISSLRERARIQVGSWTGSRVHPMLVRIGGVEYDVDATWLAEETSWCADVADATPRLEAAIAPLGLAGVGVIDAALVDSSGLSGPAARAAGLARDLRTQRPRVSPIPLPAQPLTQTAGDVEARLRQFVDDVRHATTLVRLACEALTSTSGDIAVRLPKIIRLPEGEYYEPLEGPLGETGIRLVSRGEKTPWRAFLRTPSQHDALALEQVLPGQDIAHVEAIIASLGWVAGDVDK